MAIMTRPKGSYKELLNLSASDISSLSTSQLRGIVSKLNDVANKRLRRLEETGLELFSPSYRARKSQAGLNTFSITGKESPSELRAKYASVQNFLREKGFSTKAQIWEHVQTDENAVISKILGKPLSDPSNFDKRYKKKKVLKSSVKKKISDFWDKYHEWREIYEDKNPDEKVAGTNDESVSYFEEELYSEGQTNISDFERRAREEYEKKEKGKAEDESGDVQTMPVDGRRKGTSSKSKRSGKGKRKSTIRTKFEKIKIF